LKIERLYFENSEIKFGKRVIKGLIFVMGETVCSVCCKVVGKSS